MPKDRDLQIKKLSERIDKIEKENQFFRKIFESAMPLKCVYKEDFPVWHRHYHTEQEFIDRHLDQFKFKLDKNDGNIGFLLKLDPKQIL